MKYKLTFIKISPEHKFAGVGFAGNIFIILNALTYLTENDTLFVDMETNECVCKENLFDLFKTNNCWEYYFTQNKIEDNEEYINMNWKMNLNIKYNDNYLDLSKYIYLKKLFYNSFKINDNITRIINTFYNDNLENKKTLGVQIRLTDMKYHHNVASVDVYIKKIKEILNENNVDQIFLATDDSNVINVLLDNIDIPIIYYKNMFRANSINLHNNPYDRYNDNRENHKYILGVECLQEILTLSKCDYLLKADISSISIVSIILSENIIKVYNI